jgi:hypothetical protein
MSPPKVYNSSVTDREFKVDEMLTKVFKWVI